MTPIIKSKADRRRVWRWLARMRQASDAYFRHAAILELCGPAPQPKPNKKRSKR